MFRLEFRLTRVHFFKSMTTKIIKVLKTVHANMFFILFFQIEEDLSK